MSVGVIIDAKEKWILLGQASIQMVDRNVAQHCLMVTIQRLPNRQVCCHWQSTFHMSRILGYERSTRAIATHLS